MSGERRAAEEDLPQGTILPMIHTLRSLAAARQLEKLAGELRALRGSTAHLEYIALHNWLSESDAVSELAINVEYFNERLGFGTWAEDGAGYLRALIEMARETAGMG